ncbi:MAG: anthranilate synthase component I family protein, partial [Solimonas sp.]
MTQYNRIALTRELPGDLDTPVGAYLKLAHKPYSFLLESMVGGEQWGRYSFIGLPSREVLRVVGHDITVSRDGQTVETATVTDPLPWIRAYAARHHVQPDPSLPRFSGGLVGYFGYDCVRYFEPRLARTVKPDPVGAPDILLMRAEELVVFDNLRATLTIITHANLGDEADIARAKQRLDEIEALLARPPAHKPAAPAGAGRELPFTSSFGEAPFQDAVRKVQQYIAAGDCMQVVPSQRLSTPFAADPVQLYRAIRRLNPSPYLYCMDLGDHHVVGASPEVLVRVENGLVTVRPIAGTRKRGKNAEEDAALAADLLADPKEIAEHLMLIDLG